jgi:hypothetical protein
VKAKKEISCYIFVGRWPRDAPLLEAAVLLLEVGHGVFSRIFAKITAIFSRFSFLGFSRKFGFSGGSSDFRRYFDFLNLLIR